MVRTVTLRLSDDTYQMVQQYAEAAHLSVDSWVESVLDAEDTRRRGAAQAVWMETHPGTTAER
jgi:predicted transcriptional regulator